MWGELHETGPLGKSQDPLLSRSEHLVAKEPELLPFPLPSLTFFGHPTLYSTFQIFPIPRRRVPWTHSEKQSRPKA